MRGKFNLSSDLKPINRGPIVLYYLVFLEIKEVGGIKPTCVSSVPMKMRRMRVRSLLAGCISCLRCVRSSALTCRSGPFASTPHGSPFLPARCRSLFYLFGIIIAKLSFDPSEAQQQKDLSQRIVCVHIQFTSEAIFVASPRRSSRPHLFIAATDCAEHRTRKHGPVL